MHEQRLFTKKIAENSWNETGIRAIGQTNCRIRTNVKKCNGAVETAQFIIKLVFIKLKFQANIKIAHILWILKKIVHKSCNFNFATVISFTYKYYSNQRISEEINWYEKSKFVTNHNLRIGSERRIE